MWLKAGNNLITADSADQELTVNTNTDPDPLFNVVQGGGGQDKIDSPPFESFHGNIFSLFFVFCFYYFIQSRLTRLSYP